MSRSPAREFSGDLPHCDVCSWPEASVEFVPAMRSAFFDPSRVDQEGNSWPTGRFLKRCCLRCGFEWAEAVVINPCPSEYACERCRDTGIDPEDSYSGSTQGDFPEPPALEPCRDCFTETVNARCPSVNLGDRCDLAMNHTMPYHSHNQRRWYTVGGPISSTFPE